MALKGPVASVKSDLVEPSSAVLPDHYLTEMTGLHRPALAAPYWSFNRVKAAQFHGLQGRLRLDLHGANLPSKIALNLAREVP
jgi:hypothetical protein